MRHDTLPVVPPVVPRIHKILIHVSRTGGYKGIYIFRSFCLYSHNALCRTYTCIYIYISICIHIYVSICIHVCKQLNPRKYHSKRLAWLRIYYILWKAVITEPYPPPQVSLSPFHLLTSILCSTTRWASTVSCAQTATSGHRKWTPARQTPVGRATATRTAPPGIASRTTPTSWTAWYVT